MKHNVKKYARIEELVEYKAIQYDGTKKCADRILEMCKHQECVQFIEGKGLIVANMDGTTYAEVGDYLVCGGCCCIHPVKEDYFNEHYKELV